MFFVQGHSLGFFLNFHGTLEYGRFVIAIILWPPYCCRAPDCSCNELTCIRKYFGPTEEPYTVSMPGQNLCLMSSPKQISDIFKNTTDLSYNTFIRHVLTSIGVSAPAVDKWIPLHLSEHEVKQGVHSVNAVSGELTLIGEKLCQRQLLPGKELDIVQKAFTDHINELLVWEKVLSIVPQVPSSLVVSTSLLGWCQDVLLGPATEAFFGKRLLQIDPDLVKRFCIFDDASWKLHFGYPRILSRDMHSAKDSMITSLKRYWELPREDRSDASFLIKSFEVEMREMGIEEKDMAALVMPLYWV